MHSPDSIAAALRRIADAIEAEAFASDYVTLNLHTDSHSDMSEMASALGFDGRAEVLAADSSRPFYVSRVEVGPVRISVLGPYAIVEAVTP
jgi:hypothetical protein